MGLLFYWFAVIGAFFIGLIWIIVASINGKSTKPGLKLMIGAVIMFVIGAGACAVMLSGLKIN